MKKSVVFNGLSFPMETKNSFSQFPIVHRKSLQTDKVIKVSNENQTMTMNNNASCQSVQAE